VLTKKARQVFLEEAMALLGQVDVARQSGGPEAGEVISLSTIEDRRAAVTAEAPFPNPTSLAPSAALVRKHSVSW